MLETKLELDDIIANSENVAELLPQDDLDALGKKVVEDYETDKQSRSTWEDNIDKWMDLALQVTEEKSYPWPNAANIKYPLLTTAAIQFSSRAYPSLLPGYNLVRGRVIGFDDTGEKLESAYRVGKHMSYQLTEQMDDWEEEMDRMLFALPIVGCMFKKSYFDPIKEHNVSEIIWPKELVVNYWARNIETAPRVTHTLRMSVNDIYERVQAGLYLDEQLEIETDQETTAEDNRQGLTNPRDNNDVTPFNLLEQHCLVDMDHDGYEEPYIITVDMGSSKVVRIVPRFDKDSLILGDEGELNRIIPDEYFTKFSFIPSPDGGFYDVGFGLLLGPINNTINTLINQLLDAGTLSNMQGGFIAKGLRIQGGNKNFTPGEWKYANTAGIDLKNNIVPLPVRDPSQVLFTLLSTMVESGERLSSITEMMTGEIPGQNTKATVAMAAIEQGMKVFSGIYKRLHRALSKEYKKLFALNAKYLQDEEYFVILDPGKERAEKVQRNDYANGSLDITPASDPSVATEQQRLTKVQALMEVLQLGTINPQEFTKRYLEATEQPNIEALMSMPPPQPDPEVEFEKAKFADESKREWKRLEIEEMRWESEGIARLAEAESRELGNHLDIAEKQMEEVKLGLEVEKMKDDRKKTTAEQSAKAKDNE